MTDCIFCQIATRRAPAYVLDETGDLIVFLSLENHPLVVPKAHIPDIFTLDDTTAAAVMQEAVTIAKAVRLGLGCDGVYLTQANGEAAGQDVFHFHLHVYPRWHGGKRPDVTPVRTVSDHARQRTLERLVAALHELRSDRREGG